MSTQIGSAGSLEVTRFAGGMKRGVMYQLTNLSSLDEGDFVVLNAQTAREVVALIEQDQKILSEKRPS